MINSKNIISVRRTCAFFTAETILITGGYGALQSAELLMPWSGATCRLPSLPDPRRYHTQSGTRICGGWASSVMRSCLQWSAGEGDWVKLPFSLTQQRYLHSSWTPPGSGGDTFLFGGLRDGYTSEFVTNDNSTKTFRMKNDLL